LRQVTCLQSIFKHNIGKYGRNCATIESEGEAFQEIYKSTKWNILMLFVWGDGVVLVVPPFTVD